MERIEVDYPHGAWIHEILSGHFDSGFYGQLVVKFEEGRIVLVEEGRKRKPPPEET